MGDLSGDVDRRRGWVIAACGLALILVGGFLPWLQSGRAWRDSYEVVRTADRLGLVSPGFQSALGASWYLVPLLCGLTLTAIVLGLSWAAHLGTLAVAVLAAIMTTVALRAPLPSGSGPDVVAAGALLALVGSTVATVDRRRDSPRAVTQRPGLRRRSAR